MMIQPTPPDGAIVLFDGTNLDQWTSVDGGYRSFTPADRRPNWVIEDGVLNVGDNDIMTKESFGDCFVHVEFMVPYMPEETGQARGNSGFYLQSRYEVQILDSYGKEPLDDHDCGAITVRAAPLVNACKPPLEWQTYDVFFRGARADDSGNVTERARITVLHNGIVVHNNVQLRDATTAVSGRYFGPAPLLLQDHTNPVKFRNIWLVPLPSEPKG